MPNGQPIAAPAQSYVAKMAFTYEADTAASFAATSGSAILTFNIDGDSDFFWTKTAVFALVGSAGTDVQSQEVPAVTALVTNTTNGRSYSNNPVPLPSMAGSGQLPYILPQVTYWPAKATITVQLAAISTNKTYSSIRISFHGIKAFLG